MNQEGKAMRLVIALAFLPLAACTIATSDATAVDPPPTAGACRSGALSQFIGQPASQNLGERILRASGARIIRWVPKGGVVTMDFSPHRLTVQLDGANRVESANCG
jgi:hypothetical protein